MENMQKASNSFDSYIFNKNQIISSYQFYSSNENKKTVFKIINLYKSNQQINDSTASLFYELIKKIPSNYNKTGIENLLEINDKLIQYYQGDDNKIQFLTKQKQELEETKTTKSKVFQYIFDLNPDIATNDELQKIYKLLHTELFGTQIDTNKCNNTLKYKIVCHCLKFRERNQEYLNLLFKFVKSIKEPTAEDDFTTRDLDCNVISELITCFIETGKKENLDKAYILLERLKRVDIMTLCKLTEKLLNGYKTLNEQDNKEKIEDLNKKVEELKNEKRKIEKDIIKFNLNKSTTEEQIKELYKTTKGLCGYYEDENDFKTQSKNDLIYAIASSIFGAYINKKEFLIKACDMLNTITLINEDRLEKNIKRLRGEILSYLETSEEEYSEEYSEEEYNYNNEFYIKTNEENRDESLKFKSIKILGTSLAQQCNTNKDMNDFNIFQQTSKDRMYTNTNYSNDTKVEQWNKNWNDIITTFDSLSQKQNSQQQDRGFGGADTF